jgi:hypothetical protein
MHVVPHVRGTPLGWPGAEGARTPCYPVLPFLYHIMGRALKVFCRGRAIHMVFTMGLTNHFSQQMRYMLNCQTPGVS